MKIHRFLTVLTMAGFVAASAPVALAGPSFAGRLLPLHHHDPAPPAPTERRHHPTVHLEKDQASGFHFFHGKLVRPVNRLAAPASLIQAPNPHQLRAQTPRSVDRKGRTPITIRQSGD